jgi:hypothetical protein
MHTFRVFNLNNPNIAYIRVEEGNINIETGIRMVFYFLNSSKDIIDKHLLQISANLGKSDKDIRIAILERILEYTDSIIVKE